ncbi:DUF1016 N-terminal domain-containing protein [Prevotella sp. E9-3]|uniref:DUF1016 N-terminal domain-containing protein n=1 Tax=Prevotella sp. E9-3 TaxID=2913621 RepID=UPI001EDA025F|nr:DUF1016 N-terminal domain-containing protein [Prevotella sp. E9-3]UKK48894.1 DUF1016 N-terminal domain-containing protein [Prevotella sp. E9-3]
MRLVSLISGVWDKAREKAALAVNTELLDASWETGRYIVEYEQHGNVKAEYGKQLLTNLSKDLTKLRGKGYSRSNLFNMRLFYVRFPKIQTVSGQLTWSHYLELLKCDQLVTIPAPCIEYGQRGCFGSRKRGTSSANSLGYYSRPVCAGVYWSSPTETLQGKGSGR